MPGVRRRSAPEPDRVSVPGERHARRAAADAAPRRAPTPGKGVRRGMRSLSSVIIVAGALVLTDAAVTLVWEEPLTHVFTLRQQSVLGGRLETLRAAPVTTDQRRALDQLRGARQRVAFLARALDRSAEEGSAIGEIRLPRIDERFVIVKGSDPADLRKGPGTYDGIGLPGTPGTAAIAGHRTTYGAPFRDLDRLEPGDRVTVAMPYATFTYRVERTRIVEPDDLSVLTRRRYDRLVLSACHPLYSADQRIVVLARLERTEPADVIA